MLYPGYHKNTFTQRRQNLIQSIKENNPFLIILFNSPVYPVCSDASYRHRSDSSFFYLTGFLEEESAALLWHDGKKIRYQLFVRPRDPALEQWNGLRAGVEGAKKNYGPDDAYPISELSDKVVEWFKNVSKGSLPRIYSNFSTHEKTFHQLRTITQKIVGHIRMGAADVSAYIEVLPHIRALRLIKEEHELKELRESAAINIRAHHELMTMLKPGMTEYQAQAIVEKVFIEEGAKTGYDSIAGSGPNACILHYHENERVMKDSEMLLIDAGCEFRMYQSDITRTLPVGGTYSPTQKKIMDIVLEAQQAATAVCVEGNSLADFHKTASFALIEGLKTLKLLKGTTEKIFEEGTHKKYYPHGTGHWLGLDVHDPCPCWDNGESIKFKAGMVLTVEPGLYFMENDTSVPKEFRGLGVRIEDNIVVRPKGKAPEILTADLPRSWKEIEGVKKGAKKAPPKKR